EIQDEGSQLVAALAGAGPEMRVVDYCAGAGGKTLALAMTMENRGHIGSFDRVLVDAPCTGTGTWRRNPDARLRLRERDLEELVPKQAAILDAASRLVRIGGRLIFATCSLLQRENEMQVDAFLHRTPGFRLLPLEQASSLPLPGPYLALTPLRHRTDGFFGAVLERA